MSKLHAYQLAAMEQEAKTTRIKHRRKQLEEALERHSDRERTIARDLQRKLKGEGLRTSH